MGIKMWTTVKNGRIKIFARINGVKYEIPKFSPYIPFAVESGEPLLDRTLVARVYRMQKAMYGDNIGEYAYKLNEKFIKRGTNKVATVHWVDPYKWMVQVEIPELGWCYTNYDDMNKTLSKYGYRKLG